MALETGQQYATGAPLAASRAVHQRLNELHCTTFSRMESVETHVARVETPSRERHERIGRRLFIARTTEKFSSRLRAAKRGIEYESSFTHCTQFTQV